MITLENIKLNFGSRATFNLSFKIGEIWGILGVNGSGKSTLMQTIAGLQSPQAGKVVINGHPLSTYDLKSVAQLIALLPQQNKFHFAHNVWDYCAGARFPHRSYWQRLTKMDKDIITTALQQLDLSHLAKRNIASLSGGEQRRVRIAATLIQTPHCFLLDEPTNHLDIPFQLRILCHFKALATKKLVILSVHDVNIAQQYCDKVLMLSANHYLAGNTTDILNEQNVSQLYQHPMQLLEHQEKKFWLG